ncbi:unnamed protein product [Rotaria sp. Silwood1]|nr:unnamed protein product [Rotaria sp. Silwood1]CAF1642984.1 unnamed protein product [Rotaria sp. Silwood1]CAF3785618.1 unnamed protein product [Rotaria sp. Silwood1]CAF4826672.1 unnamed protein product [Rotaria sp. Silwood1]
MTTTTETYHTTFTNSTINNNDDPSLIVANVTIDELVESCCNEVLPSSSSQLNSSSNSVSPTHLVRFVHSQSSLVSQIDETNNIQQNPSNIIISSHDIPSIKQTPYINVIKRLPSTIKPKTIIESTNSMYNTTNLTNITANNISVNNYNVNIHTTNVPQQQQSIINNEHLIKKSNSYDEKQTTEIVTQILKNIKEVDEQTTTTTNYNIHIDSFNFSSSINEQQQSIINKKSRIKKEAKALTKIIVKDDLIQSPISPNFLRTKKTIKHHQYDNTNILIESIPVPYGWQRRILSTDIVVYLSPTNTILDSLDAVRHYIESPTSCKCGLQCPLIIDKVFNFDPMKKSKSWEVVQVLEGTHCRQKSNILEMATLTNCIDSFCETEQKPVKRRKRIYNESTNGNVFVCASNLIGNSNNNNNESVVFVNNTDQISGIENSQSMTWTPIQQTNITPPSKRPRGRPRKTTVTSPIITHLAAKPSNDTYQTQPVPSSILSPPASVSSISQTNFVHRNSTSPSTIFHQTNNIRHINDNILTPPILSSSTTTTDTNVIARVPSIFDQVKTATNESTFAVLSGVQNVLLSPNRDSNNNDKRLHVDSNSSIVSTTGKQVTLNVNALKSDFVRSTSSNSKSSLSNQIDVISLMGTTNQNQLTIPKTSTMVTIPSTTHDEYISIKSTNEQINESTQPLMIDFNDPSTTNFLLSALASGASSDSNAIVNHLFQKAQTQQQQQSTTINSPTISIQKKTLPIISSNIKNCTETTNLLPSIRQSTVVLHVPTTNDINQQTQQIILNNNNDDKKQQHQQIFFINNKPYIIQQKLTHEQSSQQRLILTPSISQSNETSHSNRNIVNINNSNTCIQSTLDDGGNCLLLNGPVEPKTLRTLLKGLNSSSFSGVDNLIDTINRFEHKTTTTTNEKNDNLLIKSIRTTKKSIDTNKTPIKRRAAKKIKQEEQISISQPIIVEQQQQHQWQTDFNTFDFSTSWGSDTNLNSLLLNDDFDTAASFDDVNFGDFEPYMNGNNNNDITLPSLFVKPLPPDSLSNLDHLLP